MRRVLVLVPLVALLLGGALMVASPASACSCAGRSTAEFLDRADAVFIGRLVSREVVRPPGAIGSSADPALHVFAVETVLKGTAHAEQGVVSAESGASCGLELSGDGPFVVFATRSADLGGTEPTPLEDGRYAASLCGGTAPATPELRSELEALASAAPGPPSDPLPGAAGIDGLPTQASDTVPGWLVLVLAVVVAALSTAGLLAQRRHRAPAGSA